MIEIFSRRNATPRMCPSARPECVHHAGSAGAVVFRTQTEKGHHTHHPNAEGPGGVDIPPVLDRKVGRLVGRKMYRR